MRQRRLGSAVASFIASPVSARVSILGVFASSLLLAGCPRDLGERTPTPSKSTGQSLFGVLCDRMGAQALNEDLTGASFHDICHPDEKGKYPSTGNGVNEKALPAPDPAATDSKGKKVTLDAQKAQRAYAVNRMNAVARRRDELVATLDKIFPDQSIDVKDITNADPKKSCEPASKPRKLNDELADLLGRFTGLYNDGTIPSTTEALALALDALANGGDGVDPAAAQAAVARMQGRVGYRPSDLTLGAAAPVLAYSDLRELLNAYLALLAPDSQPYQPDPAHDANGTRVRIPGSAHDLLKALVDAAHNELLYTKADPASVHDKAPVVDVDMGRTVLKAPRTDLQILATITQSTDPSYGVRDEKSGKVNVTPHPIVVRDERGYAQVSSVKAPFVDADGDGLPDVDDLGRFVTRGGDAPPPFASVGLDVGKGGADVCGRPQGGTTGGGPPMCGGKSSSLFYNYVDTAHIYGASLMNDLRAFADPKGDNSQATLLYAAAGAKVILGPRKDGQTKCYADDTLNSASCSDSKTEITYNGVDTANSPLLDAVWALGQVLGDGSTDDVLRLGKRLFVKDDGSTSELLTNTAHLTATLLKAREIAVLDKSKPMAATSNLWDDILDVLAQTAAEPGLLEAVINGAADDRVLKLGDILSTYMSDKDLITYNPSDLNGPPINLTKGSQAVDISTPVDRTKDDTGNNRSVFQRFLQLINDATGVGLCNKDGAVVHAILNKGAPDSPEGNKIDQPLFGTFKECQVFKINDLGAFYLDSMVGGATLTYRDVLLNLFGNVKATQDSSGLTGFWDPETSNVLRPKPAWLAREVFFDQAGDTNNPLTTKFLADLNGPHTPSSVCAERVIDDPVQDPLTAPDKKVHLRSCQDGQWLDQRDPNTIFVFEQLGFFDAITPILKPFVDKKREDLFLGLQKAIFKHWATKPNAAECTIGVDAGGKALTCTKGGADRYEPMVAKQLGTTDIFTVLHDFAQQLQAIKIKHCTAVNPTTHQCAAASDVAATSVLAAAASAMFDPVHAKAIGLKDRAGKVGTVKSDGKTAIPQVTPIYLLVNALNGFDDAFANDKDADTAARLAQWRKGRSQIVDRLLSVSPAYTFVNPAVPKIAPKLIDVIREQAFAHCQNAFTAPTATCSWARNDLPASATKTIGGPLFASAVDLLDAIRKDDTATAETNKLLQYLLRPGDDNDALPGLLATATDALQVLGDDKNIVPLFSIAAKALETPKKGVGQYDLVDASLNLLGRVAGHAYDKDGTEICAKELDPNQVLTLALQNLVRTPAVKSGEDPVRTPLEVILDIIGDINRASPKAGNTANDELAAPDYRAIAQNVTDFLLDPQRGLEQFYAIVKLGTVNE